MKQKTNLMRRATLLLLTMLCSLTGAWAYELTVYEGTVTNQYVPAYVFYFDDFSRSQFVIPADDLSAMDGGTISSLKFYTTQSNVPYTTTSTVDVCLMEVDYTTMTGLEPKANGTIVYQGMLDFVSEGQGGSLTIQFQTPYSYGGGNLLIGIENTTDAGFKSIYFYGQTVNGASWAGYNSSSLDGVTGTQRNFIPKTTFEYTGGTAPLNQPTNLTVTGITDNSATINWNNPNNDEGLSGFTYKYKKATEEAWSAETDIISHSAALTGLTSGTDYNFRVKAKYNNGANESGYATVNFTTTELCPDGKICIGSGTATSNYVPTNNYYKYGLTEQIYTAEEIGEVGSILSLDFYKASTTEMVKNVDIYIVSTNKSKFESKTDWIPVTASDLVFSGTVTFTDKDWTTIVLDSPFVYDGVSNICIVVDNNTGSYVSNTPFRVFDTGAANYQALYYQNDSNDPDPTADISQEGTLLAQKNRIRLVIGESSTCLTPKNLAVNYTGGTTAQVSWTSDADAWQLAFVDGEGTITSVYNVTENPYTLTGLELATTYKLAIRTDCGSGSYSEWTSLTNPFTFSTGVCMPEDQKEITYELADSYGDGWNGAAINVVHVNTGIVVATLTLASGNSKTGTISLCCGEDYSFVWKAGNDDSECSYAFYDFNEDKIFSGNGSMSDAVNYTMVCTVIPWKTPTNLKASEIGPRSVKLSWTERSNPAATAWIVAYKSATDADFTEVNVTTNPFTLNGLTPETAYTVKVRPATNEMVKWSDEITFVTNIAAPSPTDLSVTPFVTTADVSWNGFAENYELEYAEGAFGDGWLQYDDGIYGASIGGASSNTWTWGVMYPGSMVFGNQLTKVSIFETSEYNTEDITINIYQGGDDTPGTLLYTETVTPNATDAFHEITLAAPVTVTPGENLWITLTEYGTYVLSYCASDEPNNNWVLNGDAWTHVNDLNSSLAGDGWMIRGEMIDENSSTATWIPVSNPSSPCTLEGLTAETAYTVRVKGDFGSDGKSDWVTKVFTTKSVNDIPIDLAATDITPTSAKLNWTGYQDSFNLKYRHSVAVDPSIPATIILEADDVWEDGSGYQMLLDADADTYGTLWDDNHYILVDGEQYTGGDLPAEYYDEFEYKIPISADGALSTTNVVVTGRVTLTIPAGTYDYVILNPTSGDRFYIVANNGEVGGDEDDFVFEPGVTYHFTIQRFGSGDGAAFETIRPMGEWTAVDNVTNPYTLSGLTPGSAYEWQVQGNLTSGTTAWSEVASFTALSLFTGDVNGDGNISITDAVAIVNYVLGNPPAGFIAAVADVNGDGKIDISDAVKVVNIVLNKTGE